MTPANYLFPSLEGGWYFRSLFPAGTSVLAADHRGHFFGASYVR